VKHTGNTGPILEKIYEPDIEIIFDEPMLPAVADEFDTNKIATPVINLYFQSFSAIRGN
jgi:hypothetical protein